LGLAVLTAPPSVASAATAAQQGAQGAALVTPPISARSAVLIEASTGMRLAALHPDAELPMASTTKLMTALVVLERAPLGQIVSVPPYSPGPAESVMGLFTGERITIRDLMVGMLLPSANDAAHALGAVVGGSVSRFVGWMNERGRELGLDHTHYDSPVGLDDPGTFTTADDLVHLARVLRSLAFFRQTVSRHAVTIGIGAGRKTVVNHNDLVGRIPWVNGVKTGHTNGAGYVLVGSGSAQGVTLISAVIGDPDPSSRDADTLTLLRYGFRLVRVATPVRAGELLATRPVNGHSGQRVDLVAARDLSGVVRRGAAIDRVVVAPTQLKGPLPAGSQVGEVIVRSGGRELGRDPLRVRTAVPAPSSVLSGVVLPAVIAILLLGGGTLVGVRRRHDPRPNGRGEDHLPAEHRRERPA